MSEQERGRLSADLIALLLLAGVVAGILIGRSQVIPAPACQEDEVAIMYRLGDDFSGGMLADECAPLDDLAEESGWVDEADARVACLALTSGTDAALARCSDALGLSCLTADPVSAVRASCQEHPAPDASTNTDRGGQR